MTVFSLENSEKILKFSKIVIVEFSDSPTQSLVFFLSRKTVSVRRREQNIFQMTT